MQKRVVLSAAVAAVCVGVSVASTVRGVAQQTAPARSSVTVVRVKPDMVDAWVDFQTKRTIPALKKAGVTQRDVYRSAYGQAFEFRIVQPVAKLADRDNPASPIERALGAPAAKEYNDALRKMIASQQTWIIQSMADASFDPDPNAIHKILVLTTTHVAPGRAGDYTNYVRSDLLAAQKKGQAKRFLVSRVLFGGDSNEFRLASFEDKFADLDGDSPVVRALGADGAAKMAQKTVGIVMSSQRVVYVREDALSFRTRPIS
jgi:hypothetical protein